MTSIRKLEDRWGWSNTKINKFLKVLENQNMLKRESDKKKTLLTLINYRKFQDINITETSMKHHTNDTETSLKHTNNNLNNLNNDNKEIYKDLIYQKCVEHNIKNTVLKIAVVKSYKQHLTDDIIFQSIERSAGKDIEYLITVLKNKKEELETKPNIPSVVPFAGSRKNADFGTRNKHQSPALSITYQDQKNPTTPEEIAEMLELAGLLDKNQNKGESKT